MSKIFFLFLWTMGFVSCQQELKLTEEQASNVQKESNLWTPQVIEMEIDEMLLDLSKKLRPSKVLFNNVNILSMESEQIRSGMDVLVVDGKIEKIEAKGNLKRDDVDKVVDGTGKYLMPGLTDAHVHIGASNSEKLLNILTGVTTVREMCGFDWMIDYAEQIQTNSILAPNTYVAGTMLNYNSLGIYSTVVKTEAEALEAVRRQKELGYDFIKVWNNMPLSILEVIAKECQRLEIDLIGHIPHNVTVEQALSIGYKVQEHFKGFILDNKLRLTSENYVDVLNDYEGEEFWLSPTFALHVQGLRGEEAVKRLNSHPAYHFISTAIKRNWLQNAQNYQFGGFGNIPDSIYKMQREIFNKITPAFKNFLAGTDNNGANPNMVAGFSLQDELIAFKELGLSNFEIIRTATMNPATAMNREIEYGSVTIGKRADLILLDNNPLEKLENLFEPSGIMIRGIWIEKEENQCLRRELSTIYAQSDETLGKDPELKFQALINHFKRDDMGYLMQPFKMIGFATIMEKLNFQDDALELLTKCTQSYPYYYSFDALGKHYLEYRNDPQSALKYFRESQSMYPNGEVAKSAIATLER